MKYPAVLRVFAIINLLVFIILLFQSLLFYFEPKGLLIDLSSVFAALWLLTTSVVWIFGSRLSYSFIYLTTICLFILAGTTLDLAFVLRDFQQEKGSFLPLFIYSIVIAVYGILVLSTMLLRSVKRWLAENNFKKFDRTPVISFVLCLIIPGAVLLVLDKLHTQYISIESTYSGSLLNDDLSNDVTIDLYHLTEFDGILLSKNAEISELKLVVCYSDNWNNKPSANLESFRRDTLLFKPLASNVIRNGLPMAAGSLSTTYLIAKMPVVKARRIIFKDLRSTSLYTQPFVFTTIHSGNHFERLSENKFVDFNDGGRPMTNQTVALQSSQALDSSDHTPLSTETRALLIKSFFETMAADSYSSYLFTSRKTIRLNELNVGMYKEFRNMFDSYGQKSIEAVYSDSGNSLEGGLTKVSALSPYLADETMPFKHVNPIFVEWVERYCLPNADEEFLGFTTKEIYETIFRRMIWMLAAAHEFLDDRNFDSEAHEYFIRATNGDSTFNALPYLGNRYSERLEKSYNSFTKVDEKFRDDMQNNYFPFNENIAIGFWLRRRLDGSEDEVWKLVINILSTYDNYPYEGK